jgi:hypothetical protein
MAAFQNNLLVRLHKWAVRQDENFLTEVFAFLLNHLAESEPEAATEIVARITGGAICLSPQQIRVLEVRTQITGEEGIPDIELRTAQHFVIIEVKNEAEATQDQLNRYRRLLDQSPVASKGLILLTRYPVNVSGADYYLRWYQVAEYLEQESRKYVFKPASQFLIDQCLGFLKARNMTMSQVTWELPTGIRSMRTLAEMLAEAAAACGLRASIKGNSDWIGIFLDGKLFWAGIVFDSPERLVFGTHYANVNPELAEALGVGFVYEWDSKDGHEWRRDIDLEAEEIHFFARSKASQMQFLEQFLRENLELAKKIIEKGADPEQPTTDQADDE